MLSAEDRMIYRRLEDQCGPIQGDFIAEEDLDVSRNTSNREKVGTINFVIEYVRNPITGLRCSIRGSINDTTVKTPLEAES